ncbi:BA75_00421T0 [Komagataella pastoris]|uniref:BA75_00421T0 n=1 Tax=Komagataella pastoris TaxID=4922 RepID=A0A1B2J7K6_PICPA|nr:BA75_00421T0 [Komagataella pastoris]
MPQTPWLKKTKDPFESPNMSKSFDNSVLKETQITPVAAARSKTAHGIFEQLRKNHAVVQEFEVLDGIVVDEADVQDHSTSSLKLNDRILKQNDTFDSTLSHDTPSHRIPFDATQKDILPPSDTLAVSEGNIVSILDTQSSTQKDLHSTWESQEKMAPMLKDTQVIDTSNMPTSTQADDDYKSMTKEYLLGGTSQLGPTQIIEKSTQTIQGTPNQKFIQVPGTAEREIASINASRLPKRHDLTDPENSQIIESSFSNIKSQNGDEEDNDEGSAFPNNLLFDTLERLTPKRKKNSSESISFSPGKQNVSTPKEKEFLSSEVTEELTDIEDERALDFKEARHSKTKRTLSSLDKMQEQNKHIGSNFLSPRKPNYSQNADFMFSQQSFKGSPTRRTLFDGNEAEEEIHSDYEKQQTLDTNSRTSSLSDLLENHDVIFDSFQSPPSKDLRVSNKFNIDLGQKDDIHRKEKCEDYILSQADVINKAAVWVKIGSKIIPGNIVDFDGTSVDVSDGADVFRIREMNILGLLDIKIGDVIKWKSLKRRTCIVTGLAFDETASTDNTDIQCSRGFSTVYLKEYKKGLDFEKAEEKKVGLNEIYLSGTLFRCPTRSKLFNDTEFFKNYLFQVKETLGLTSKHQNNDYGVFSGCLFAITGTTDKNGKEILDLKAEIDSNGGKILENGFRPFFLDSNTQLVDSEHNLQLTPKDTLDTFSFAAIISNGVVRTPKYLEALALGWPVLGHEFIGDCLKDSKTFSRWKAYLLPAGKTKQVSGLKSIEISSFINNFEAGKNLCSQLRANNYKMNGMRLLVIQDGDQVKAGVVEFLAYCFGVRSLDKPANYLEAVSIIEKYHTSNGCSNDCECALYDDKTIKKITVSLDLAYEKIDDQNRDYHQTEGVVSETKTKKRRFYSQDLITTRRRRTVKKINYNEDSDDEPEIKSKRSKSLSKPLTKNLPQSKRSRIQLLNWEWMTEVIVSGEVWPPSGNYN